MRSRSTSTWPLPRTVEGASRRACSVSTHPVFQFSVRSRRCDPDASSAAARRRLPPPPVFVAAALSVEGGRAALEVHHWTSERAGDAVDRLYPRDHQFAQLVDGARLGPDDHIVGADHILGLLHTLDLGDLFGDLGGLADLGLDKDVCRHHRDRPPCVTPSAAPVAPGAKGWWHAVAGSGDPMAARSRRSDDSRLRLAAAGI
jgi:hypothetical protein